MSSPGKRSGGGGGNGEEDQPILDTIDSVQLKLESLVLARTRDILQLRPFIAPTAFINFVVGDDEYSEDFLVHEQIATQASPILSAAFSKTFLEGTKKTYLLSDVSPLTCRLFVQFMYSDKITFQFHNADQSQDISQTGEKGHDEECALEDQTLVELWVLGERFKMGKLQNYIMDHMERVRLAYGTMNACCLVYIYENTVPDSLLRRYVVHQFAWATDNDNLLTQRLELFPKEMLADLMLEFRAAIPHYDTVPNSSHWQGGPDFYVHE